MPAGDSDRVGAQRTVKLQAQKMMIIEVGDPDRLRLHSPGRSLQTVDGTDGSTRDFQRNRRRFGQRTANNYQSPTRRDVNGGGKFEGILAIFVPGTDKNGNGDL